MKVNDDKASTGQQRKKPARQPNQKKQNTPKAFPPLPPHDSAPSIPDGLGLFCLPCLPLEPLQFYADLKLGALIDPLAEKSLWDSDTVGLTILDHQWNYIYVSKKAAEHLQCAPEDLLGKCLWNLFPYSKNSPFTTFLQKALDQKTSVHFELFLPAQNNWIQFDIYPSQIGLYVFGRDITQRKQEEERIRKSEEHFRLLAELIPQMVWTHQANGETDYFNKRWLEYTGLTFEQSLGSKWLSAIHPEDVERTISVWNQSVKEEKDYTIEYRIKRGADGAYRWHLGRAISFKDAQGNTLKWFGTCTDIDDQKRAEEVISQANEELKRLNRLRSDFTSMVAHELRTPLTVIKEGIEITLDGIDGPVTKEQKKTLIISKNNVGRLERLINNILDFTKISSGRVGLSLEEVNLNSLVQETYHLMKIVAQRRHIDFSVSLPQTETFVLCDPDKIRQVVINLIDNAIKFTERKGQIHLNLLCLKEQAILEIQDNGIGISKEDQQKIFEMFGQSMNIRGMWKTGGAGIGLSLCKKIVEQHHGSITVMSEPGKGAKFTVILPKHFNQNQLVIS